jgi:imidazolonepropionase-like amidohydrolase
MRKLLLRRGNVLHPEDGNIASGCDVLIEDKHITQVGPNLPAPADAEIVDVEGRTVMPGLIDCHVHVVASIVDIGANSHQPASLAIIKALPIMKAMLMRGFTTVRDAGGADWGLAQAVEQELVPGPRIFCSGKALSQTGGHGDFRKRSDYLEPCACSLRSGALARVVDGVDNVRLAAREEIQKGASQIKIMASGGVASPVDPIAHTQYSEEEIKAIVHEARAANTYVMAHAYTARAIAHSVRCGVRTIEHGNLVDKEAAALMAQERAYAVPTLVTYDALKEHGARLGLPAESIPKIETVQVAGRRSLGIYAEAGVVMAYGSDLLGDMHQYQSEEFIIRAEVLGNLEAIRSATIHAAEVLDRVGVLGTIRRGALADIVVCDGNPLTSIDILAGQGEKITHIIQGGQVRKRPAMIS